MTKSKKIKTRVDNNEYFKHRMTGMSALASHSIKDSFDLDKAVEKCTDSLEALKTKDGIQTMLASQMIGLHELQQMSLGMANNISNIEHQKYYINSAVKLANAFTQQATLLAKLQGVAGQKIIVERVDVHNGGNAVVGNISTREAKE